MTTKHTPGPWDRDGLTVYALHHNGDYIKGKPLLVNRFFLHIEPCTHQGGTLVEAEANARLIAAAPALLEAAQAALAHVLDLEDAWARGAFSDYDTGNKGIGRSNRNVDVRVALRAAIAAATGTE